MKYYRCKIGEVDLKPFKKIEKQYKCIYFSIYAAIFRSIYHSSILVRRVLQQFVWEFRLSVPREETNGVTKAFNHMRRASRKLNRIKAQLESNRHVK